MFVVLAASILNGGGNALGDFGNIHPAQRRDRNRLLLAIESDRFKRWFFGENFRDGTRKTFCVFRFHLR
jgi:hypothetical protein